MRNIKFISCAILIFFAMCISALALSGTGTEADPYLVSTPSDIALMHNDLDGYYKLTADIDMKDIDFEPIGNESEGAFTGTIDGDGHTISNLNVNLPGNKYVGFVGYLEGTVKNLNLENVDACGYCYVGGVAGCLGIGGLINNCIIDGSIEAKQLIGEPICGGLVGQNDSGTITYSQNKAIVSKYATSVKYSGGICGLSKSGNIDNCINYGAVFSLGYSGGIVGCSNNLTIKNCVNYANITVDAYHSYAGGILGDDSYSTVLNCVNYGEIICNYNSPYRVCLGGITGSGGIAEYCINLGIIDTQHGSYVFLGGISGRGTVQKCINYTNYKEAYHSHLAGITSSGTINNCISLGLPVGGFTHYSYLGDSHSINLSNSISFSREAPITGTSNAVSNIYTMYELLPKNEFVNTENVLNYEMFGIIDSLYLDFDNVWFTDANTNSGFPQLRNMPRHIDLNECVLLLKVGESDKLEAFIDGVPESVTWLSENEDIATVSADGTVTAIATGDIMITATNAEGMKMNCLVHITKDVSSVSLNKTETKITAGSSETITYTLNPVDANEAVMWSSSNKSVATIDQSGVVTANAKGTATITVTTVTSNKTASCEVTVVGKPITNVSIPGSATINKGSPYKLSLTVSPTRYEGTVTWSSSDESVATVSQDGTVTGHKGGNAVITARSDTGYSSTCSVTVKVPASSITLNKTEVTLETGFTEKLVAILEPADTTDTVSWSSASAGWVSVDSVGMITAKASGVSVRIDATTTSGLKAYCWVTVVDPQTPVSSVTLDNTELVMTKADTKQLTATVLPTNATDTTLTWTTSDEEVATVSNTGVVTAVGEGVAIIRVESNNGIYRECVVKVISASGPSVVLADAKASPGGIATVKASIVKNPGISAYKFKVEYDSGILTPLSIIPNAGFGGTFTTNLEDDERTELNVLWHSTENTDIDGDLFAIDFAVNEDAEYGDQANVSLSYGATDICNTSGEYIALYMDDAIIEIKEPLPGDVYEDDEINVYDLTLLARYITGLEAFTERQETAADVNNDIVVDIKDVVKLSQYLVGWTGAELMSESSEGFADIRIGTVSVDSNGEAVIPVYIENNSGIAGFRYEIEYSADELEIVSITPNTDILPENFRTNLCEEEDNGLIVTWYQNDDMTDEGVIFNIHVKLKQDISTISIVEADNNMCNSGTENVIGNYISGYVLPSDVPSTYIITYDANGGEDAPEQQMKTYGFDITLSDAEPVREGYTFLGWSEEDDTEETTYSCGDSFTENKDVILYAVWKADKVDVTGVELDKDSVTLKTGESVSMIANVLPDNASDKSVIWTSYDESIAVVDNGEITAISTGTTTVTVTTVNGEFTDSVQVYVYLPGELNGDESVDINDAVLLLQHSMFPELYTLDYVGNVDFNNDGKIDVIFGGGYSFEEMISNEIAQ